MCIEIHWCTCLLYTSEMKLIDAEYTFDNNKVLFYFTADGQMCIRDSCSPDVRKNGHLRSGLHGLHLQIVESEDSVCAVQEVRRSHWLRLLR